MKHTISNSPMIDGQRIFVHRSLQAYLLLAGRLRGGGFEPEKAGKVGRFRS